jgi:AbrB family looped-hinge helix DNA binding protein
MTYTATITSKGQITIPRMARMALKGTTVEIEIRGEEVILRPVQSVAGALSAYAGGKEGLTEIRGKVWQEVADEKAGHAA